MSNAHSESARLDPGRPRLCRLVRWLVFEQSRDGLFAFPPLQRLVTLGTDPRAFAAYLPSVGRAPNLGLTELTSLRPRDGNEHSDGDDQSDTPANRIQRPEISNDTEDDDRTTT